MTAGTSELLGADRLRALLEAGRRPLLQRVEDLSQGTADDPSELGLGLGRAHARVLDELLVPMWPAALEAAGSDGEGLVLAGVGGYGRGAMALGSDVDLRILARDPPGAQLVAERLLYPLWDAGLSVGHQVVSADDLLNAAREDLPTATSLLDWRFVAGERELSDQLQRRAAQGVFSASGMPEFLERLDEEVSARHKRFGASVYMLEPDVKNGRGALRDLDVAWWAVRARWSVDDFAALPLIGALLPRQLRAVAEARERLWRIRNGLHAQAGRRSDRLSFDRQESIVVPLGYASAEEAAPPSGALPLGQVDRRLGHAVERMMSDYYRAARTISRFREMITARAQPTLKRVRQAYEDLGDGLQLFGGGACIVEPDRIRTDPAIALRVVIAAVDRGIGLRPSTRGALIDACGDEDWTERLRHCEEAAQLFVELVCSCAETKLKAGSVMRELHEVGLLLAMVPEFGPVVGRVHHDTYHVYTVDVHSVAAVDRLVEIVRGDIVVDDSEGDRWVGSLACRLASEVTRPRVVFFATLLHDIGKAIGGRDHSVRGAKMAHAILARLGFVSEDIDAVARLIEHHLTMYHTATRRDLDDPTTAAEFAQIVRDSEGLHDLYLLTVADLSTTSATSMTSWKARMLDELFIATDAHLRGSPVAATAIDSVLEQLSDIATDADDTGLIERFVRAMPPRYTAVNSPESILAHTKLVSRQLESGEPASVMLVPERRFGAAEVGIVAPDRVGLLAAIAAALAASRLNVHGAQIYSCDPTSEQDGRLAVDLFWVHHSGGDNAVAGAVAKLERCLRAVLSGEQNAAALASPRRDGRRSVAGPQVQTKVIIDNRASPEHTVVEVLTRDRPGLLFELSNAIFEQGLSIAVAKIATEGTRAADVFYVSERDGKKVTVGERMEALRNALLLHIEGLDEAAS